MGAPSTAQAELTPEQMAQMAQRTQPRGAANPPPPAGYPPAGYPAGYPQQQYPAGYPQQQYPAGYPQQQYPAGYPQQQQYPPQQAGAYYAQQPYQQAGPSGYKPPTVGGVQGGAGYDPEAAASSYAAGTFSERAVRAAFIRKVILLVMLQLAITTGVAAVFMFVKPVKNYVRNEGQWLFWVSWVLALVGIIALTCSTTIRRRWPYNLLALFGFTFVMSVLVGCVVAYGDVQIVLIAFGTTAGLVATLTFIAVVLPFDITKKGHVLGAAAMMFMVAVLITVLVGIWYANKWWYLVISCIGALLFSAFLIYDLQMVIGGDKHKYSISPDEYVFASVQIYLDVVTIFLYILSIGNIASS